MVPSQQENIHVHSFVLEPEERSQYTYTYVNNSERHRFWIRYTYLALFAMIYLVADMNARTWKMVFVDEFDFNTKHTRHKSPGNSKCIYSSARGSLFSDESDLPSGAPGLHALLNYLGSNFRLIILTLTPLIVLGIHFKSVIGALWDCTCTPEITVTLLNCFQTSFPKLHLHLHFYYSFWIPCVSKQCPADGVWRIGRGVFPDRVRKTRFTPSESSAGQFVPSESTVAPKQCPANGVRRILCGLVSRHGLLDTAKKHMGIANAEVPAILFFRSVLKFWSDFIFALPCKRENKIGSKIKSGS